MSPKWRNCWWSSESDVSVDGCWACWFVKVSESKAYVVAITRDGVVAAKATEAPAGPLESRIKTTVSANFVASIRMLMLYSRKSSVMITRSP